MPDLQEVNLFAQQFVAHAQIGHQRFQPLGLFVLDVDFPRFQIGRAALQKLLPSARPRVLPCLSLFIPLGSAKAVRFCIQQGVQRLLHRTAHHFSPMLLYLPLINLDHLTQLRYFLA